PMEAIIGMYSAILPGADTLIECLLIFNLPFTFAKGLIAALISVPLYKRLRPIFNSSYGAEK
ncbi:MAG: ECF transporter S component, partial [Oscillospiraceae bacterium]